MMDRNREARRAAAMSNGLPRRRHRTTSGSLRDSPEDDGPLELQETARLRDRTLKKDRDREMRDRDRDRDRDRLSRSKRRRGDKYMQGSNREDGAVDDSSEESVNDEDEDDDDGLVRYVPPTNPVPMPSSLAASALISHRKSYPPPTKVSRQAVAPTWKAPDEMIGFSIPRKARSASTKRGHENWSLGGGGVVSGEQIHRQASSSPVRSTMTAAATAPSQSPAPMSPSSSNVSIKKKIPNGPKQKPPKSCLKTSSPPIQDDIEIEVAEVLYGLKRQSQAPSLTQETGAAVSNDSAKFDSRDMNKSTGDSKSRVSSPISAPLQPTTTPPQNSSAASLTTVAPKRKRPRPYPDENPAAVGSRSRPISPNPKTEADQALKAEATSPSTEKNLVGSAMENGDLANSHVPTVPPLDSALSAVANGFVLDAKQPAVANGSTSDAKPAMVEQSGGRDGLVKAKAEEASSSPKMESQDQNRVETTSTSIKPNLAVAEKENHREEKFEIDLMAPPPQSRASPEREGEGDYGAGGGGGATMGDEKPMVTDREADAKPKGEGDEKGVKLNASEAEAEAKAKPRSLASGAQSQAQSQSQSQPEPHKQQPPPCEPQQLNLSSSSKERNIDLQLDDLEKANTAALAKDHHKLDSQQQQQLQKQPQPPRKIAKDEPTTDKSGQSSSVPLPMSVAAGWHGGLGPMGYVAPLPGVVSMDGSTPLQGPHFVFSPPKPKRCATHCYIARSISAHQQVVKMHPYWSAAAAAAGTAPIFGPKTYNLNMVPPPPDLHAAAAAAASAGRGGMANAAAQDKAQPFALFTSQPASKDKSPLPTNAPDANAQKKQFLLPQSLPPGPAGNLLHAPAFFFPFSQQQQAAVAAAAAASARPSSTKSPSTSAVSTTTTSTSATMGAASSAPVAAGPAMSFSYPNMSGNETQFMAILGNGTYPFPVPAHVGAAPPYRGSHPQAMSFFNSSYYSSQMLHPSQLQQQQQQPAATQSTQIQQQNHQNPSISTASSSSQKHLQNQRQRPQGGGATAAGTSNPSWQNFQAGKSRPSQPHHDMGGEDIPSTADSRTRPNFGVYGQNFAMPFHSPNFVMAPPSSVGGSGSNVGGTPNGNQGDKKQQQQQPQQQALKAGIETLTPAFPISFASVNGATTPGFDISSMAQNHAILPSLPEAARHNYQITATAAQAAHAAHQKKNNYRGPEDGKTGASNAADASNAEEERKAMASRASVASVGQSIAFSRDFAENTMSTVPASSVVDSSARSLNLVTASARPSRSLGPNAVTNSNSSNSQQQQQQQQMLFPKQQQFVAATVAAARSKNPATSNGSVYPDHLNSSVIAASAKFTNALPSLPPLVQNGGSSIQSPHWKNSVRSNTSQVTSPSLPATSAAPSNKSLPQQQGRPQQNHTQISFGSVAAANPKPPSSQGQQTQNSNQAPSPPIMVGSPSTSSLSKSAGGSPRTATSASTGNKPGAQATLLTQQGKNSPSPSLSGQKPSILGSPHIIQAASAGGKPQLHESQQQPQISKQSIQQAQLLFPSAYMQACANPSAAASAGSGYYLQRHRPENQQSQQQQQQQQQQGPKSQGSGTPTSSSAMLSLATPVSLANAGTSDPAKAMAAATNSMKGLPAQGIFHAAQFAQSAGGGTHPLLPAGFPYVHGVPTAVQVKPAEQKQPAGE